MLESFIRFALQRWEGQLRPEYDGFCRMLSEYAERPCTLGILGLQSAGKTTLINACLGYPVLPALLTKGTVCPMRIEWGEKPSLQVRMCHREREWEVGISDKILEQIFPRLLEYVCLCVNLAVFYPENLSYFLEEEKSPGALTPQDILMDPKDVRHVIALVLIALNAHVEASGSACGAILQPVKEAQQRLLKMLGLDTGEMKSLCLSWNSPLLKEGLCLVDLPGVGSGSTADGKSDTLGEIACDWAKHMDVLLCMTTQEVVGGQMQQILEKIYSDDTIRNKPLPVLIVNRAEEIVNPAIVIHTAQQLLWFLSPACYLISAAAGEYRYLEENIPVGRTRYWRNIFLPEYQPELSAEVIPGNVEAPVGKRLPEYGTRARQKLLECYTRKYDSVGADGAVLSVSLKEFLENELPELVMERARQDFYDACQGYPDAVNLLKRLTEKDIEVLSTMLGDLHAIWGDFRERVGYAISRFQEACSAAEQHMRCACMEFHDQMLLFPEILGQAVENLNTSFSQEILHGMECKQHFGMLVCKAGSLSHVCETFDYISFFVPAFRSYEEAFRKAGESIKQADGAMESALKQFQEELSDLPVSYRKKCKDLGYDEQLTMRSLINRMQEYVKQIIHQCRDIFPNGQESFPVKSVDIEFGWESHAGAFVSKAICEAAVVRWGKDRGQTFIVKKKRLAETLSRPLISDELAERLLRQPLRSKTGEAQRGLDEISHEHETFRTALGQQADHWKSQAEDAESGIRLEMEGELNALQEWRCFVPSFIVDTRY